MGSENTDRPHKDILMLTVDAIREHIGAITEAAKRNKIGQAIGLEDDLWEAVLRAIKFGSADDAQACAAAALESRGVLFPRVLEMPVVELQANITKAVLVITR